MKVQILLLTLVMATAFALTWNVQTCYNGKMLIYGYLDSGENAPNVYVKIYDSTGTLVGEGPAEFYSDYQDGKGVGFFVYEVGPGLSSGDYLVSINTPEGSDLKTVEVPTAMPTYSFKIVEITDSEIALYFDVGNGVGVDLTVDGRYNDVDQTLDVSEDGYQFITYAHADNEIVVVSDGFCYDYWIFHNPQTYYAVDVSYPELSAQLGDMLNFTIKLTNKGDPIDLTLTSDAELNVTSVHLERNEVAFVRVITKYSGSDVSITIDPIGTYTIPVKMLAPQLVVESVVMPTAYKGETVTGYVLVRNDGEKEANVRFKYEYGGQLYVDSRERTILPGDETQFYFTITPEEGTITFYIGNLTYTYTFTVYERQRKFEVNLIEIPAVVDAGEKAYAELEIENTGDYYDIYRISVSGVSYAYAQKTAVSLEPGEDAKVRIYIQPDADERVGFKTMQVEVCGLRECKDLSIEFYVNQPEEKQTVVTVPEKVEYHKEFNFTVNVTNIGDVAKSYEVRCKELNETWAFVLEPNETKSIEVSGNGSYEKLTFVVEVNGVEIVKEIELTPEGIPTGAFVGGAASILWVIPIALIVAALAYFYYFKK